MGKKVLGVNNETMKILLSHNWPGGVRELENVIERAVIFAKEDIIQPQNLSDNLRGSYTVANFPDSLKDAVKNFEREHILRIFKKCNYNKEEASKILNIGLSSLYRKMEELDIPTRIKEGL